MEIGIEPLSHANNYRIVGRLLAFDDAPHLFLKSKQRCKGARDSAPGHHSKLVDEVDHLIRWIK